MSNHTDPTTVILGAGQAGGETAIWLRQFGHTGRIVLVGEEPHPPYRRPPLSKAYLSGKQALATLLIRPAQAYADLGIELLTGIRAVAIDRNKPCVALADGRILPYDRLVLALGGRVRRLTLPGADAPNLLYLRSLDDADALARHLVEGHRMVVVGGGYVGLEVAATAVKAGMLVTVLEASPRLLARVAEPDLSAFFEALHRSEGVEVRTNAAVTGFDRHGERITAVRVGDERIPADVVVAGIGLIPNVELANDAGLAVEDGILVDEQARTSDPLILAVGDCANPVNPPLGRRLRLESVPSASELARAAAATIIGSPKPVAAIPWFWSEQFTVKLQMAGLPDNHDSIIQRGTMETRSFSLFYRKGERLLAVASVNRMAEFPIVRELIARHAVIPATQLADTAIPLKTLLESGSLSQVRPHGANATG